MVAARSLPLYVAKKSHPSPFGAPHLTAQLRTSFAPTCEKLMTTNLPEFPVGVADVQPLFDCPDWLCIRLDPKLSRGSRQLSDTFLRAACLILQPMQPRQAVVVCDVLGGALSILFDISPPCGPVEQSALFNVAEAFQELHNRRFAAEVRESARAAEEPAIVFDPDDFGLDARVTQLPPHNVVDVFRFAENAEQMEHRIKGRDSDAGRRVAKTFERLALSGTCRPLAAPPADWHKRLDDFVRAFPNFADVIETAIYPHVALCATGLQHRLAPILLVGGPGIGKTLFSNAMAELLGTPPPLFVSMAAETNSSTLAGSSTFWSNSSPGQLFESIAWGRAGHSPVANGLIVLDEVDKANTTEYSALGPLYSLLEEHTARDFVDQSLPDLVFDASRLRIFATCNDAEEVPAPLRSRMLVFHITEPAADQLIVIAERILAEMVRKMEVQFRVELPQALDRQIKGMSPRSIKLSLEIAFARAVVADRDHLIPEDWPTLRGDRLSATHRHAMGFVTH